MPCHPSTVVAFDLHVHQARSYLWWWLKQRALAFLIKNNSHLIPDCSDFSALFLFNLKIKKKRRQYHQVEPVFPSKDSHFSSGKWKSHYIDNATEKLVELSRRNVSNIGPEMAACYAREKYRVCRVILLLLLPPWRKQCKKKKYIYIYICQGSLSFSELNDFCTFFSFYLKSRMYSVLGICGRAEVSNLAGCKICCNGRCWLWKGSSIQPLSRSSDCRQFTSAWHNGGLKRAPASI